MFFITYSRRELGRRMLQAISIALGLALGVGLVVTVAAASAGFKKAQSDVLSALYGAGADVTVTGAAGSAHAGRIARGADRRTLRRSPSGGWEVCTSNGKCANPDGTTRDMMNAAYNGISASKVAEAARLDDVGAAAGGFSLLDQWVTWPKSGTALPQSGSYWLDGVDTGHLSLGPLSSASLVSGHSFTAADSDADVALVDSGYAKANGLKIGSALTIQQVKYTVMGIVSQPQEGNPTDVYVPLAQAQAMSAAGWQRDKRGEHDLPDRSQRRRHPRGQQGDLRTAARHHRDHRGQPGQPGDRVGGQRREAGQRPGQVAVGAGADRRVRRGLPADDGRGDQAGRRVRHAEGDRLAVAPDHRPGARRIGDHRHRRGRSRGRSRVRRRGDHRRGRAEGVRDGRRERRPPGHWAARHPHPR